MSRGEHEAVNMRYKHELPVGNFQKTAKHLEDEHGGREGWNLAKSAQQTGKFQMWQKSRRWSDLHSTRASTQIPSFERTHSSFIGWFVVRKQKEIVTSDGRWRTTLPTCSLRRVLSLRILFSQIAKNITLIRGDNSIKLHEVLSIPISLRIWCWSHCHIYLTAHMNDQRQKCALPSMIIYSFIGRPSSHFSIFDYFHRYFLNNCSLLHWFR